MSGQGRRAPRGEEQKRNPADTREGGGGATSRLLLHRRCYSVRSQVWSQADARRSRSRPRPASRVPCPNPPGPQVAKPLPPKQRPQLLTVCLDHNGEAEAATAHLDLQAITIFAAFCGTGGSLVFLLFSFPPPAVHPSPRVQMSWHFSHQLPGQIGADRGVGTPPFLTGLRCRATHAGPQQTEVSVSVEGLGCSRLPTAAAERHTHSFWRPRCSQGSRLKAQAQASFLHKPPLSPETLI